MKNLNSSLKLKNNQEGVFLVHKESGMTSHDVIVKIKKKFNFFKIGHTGTLDPLAEGLMLVLINRATKMNFMFEKLDKTYEGTILFHKNYDTLDTTGNLIEEKQNHFLTPQMIEESFNFFHQKKYYQTPPIYSAIKIKGQKLYFLARKKIKINIPSRKIQIHKLKKISHLIENTINFETKVSKGTYIRSLASDIALRMNTFGALKKLTRTKIGPYELKKAKKIEQINLEDLIPTTNFFTSYQKIVLNDYLIKLVKNGIFLDQRQIKTKSPFIVLDEKKKFIAFYEPIQKNKYLPKYFFK